jgi:hypothetical protein
MYDKISGPAGNMQPYSNRLLTKYPKKNQSCPNFSSAQIPKHLTHLKDAVRRMLTQKGYTHYARKLRFEKSACLNQLNWLLSKSSKSNCKTHRINQKKVSFNKSFMLGATSRKKA